MAFDTSLINGVSYAANDVASLNAFTNNGNGTFTVNAGAYGGAFSDFWGPSPAANVATVTLGAYNPTLAPGIITYSLTYQNGTVVPGFGGEVIAWGPHSLLVEVLDGFVANNQAAGTYVGTLDPTNLLWLSASDISYNSNGGNGPNFPVTFANSGPFSPTAPVPEPASYALLVVALMVLTIARTPIVRRFFNRMA
jgi:hypothetical protein